MLARYTAGSERARKCHCALAMAIAVTAFAPPAGAATVDFVDGGVHFMDVFLTVTPRTEFEKAYLLVTPIEGSLLDPIRNLPGDAGNFDNVTDGARLDTWANSLLSSVGAGAAAYIFNEYHPGSPSVPPDPVPTAGAAIDQLNWHVFETAVPDILLDFEFHFARILYTPGGRGTIALRAFDSFNSFSGGELFTSPYGIPEPSPMSLAGAGLLSCVQLLRKGKSRVLVVRWLGYGNSMGEITTATR